MNELLPPGSLEAWGASADTLRRRACRPPDFEARSRTLERLARGLDSAPDEQLRRIAVAALELCGADSVGFSVVAEGADGGETFRWHHSTSPASCPDIPIPLSIQATAPDGVILAENPQREHPALMAADPTVVEALLAPLHVDGAPVARLWVLSHTPEHRFDAEDARSLVSLARFAAAAWRAREHGRARTDDGEQSQDQIGERGEVRLVASCEDAVIATDREGRIRIWNPGAVHLFGYDADEAIGQPDTLVAPADGRDQDPWMLKRIRNGAPTTRYDTVWQHRDGSLIDVSLTLSPMFAGDGSAAGAAVIARKVTERKRTERLLVATKAAAERQKRLYEAFMASTPDLVWVIDRDYRFTFANQAVLRMWGRTYDQVIGKRLREIGYELWCAEQRERLFDEVVASRQSLRTEVSFHHATLGERMYDLIVSPVLDRDGEVEAVAGTTRDITEKKQTEHELRESRQRLTELNRSLEQRVAERTQALQHQTDRLRTLAVELTTAEQRERRRLAAMLHDDLQQLLVAAQIKLGRTRSQAEDAAMAKAIAGVERLLDETMAASRNLTRQLRPPVLYEDGLISALKGLAANIEERHLLAVTVDADVQVTALGEDLEAMLYESIRELLLNVVKHAHVDHATVEVRRHADELRLAVCDRGRGFDSAADALEAHRLEGFGLFSVRERLTALGGDVHIQSVPGEWTRVELAVPAAAIADQAAAESAPARGPPSAEHPSTSDAHRVRVMVADDHALVRQGIAHVLAEHERLAVIAQAGDGLEALALMQQQCPDIVLMDVNMPRMNGIEATREVSRRWPDVMTIGLSVHEDEATAERMRAAGAVGLLSKAGDAGQMVAGLLALVDAGRA